jgi:hypothetical protein
VPSLPQQEANEVLSWNTPMSAAQVGADFNGLLSWLEFRNRVRRAVVMARHSAC